MSRLCATAWRRLGGRGKGPTRLLPLLVFLVLASPADAELKPVAISPDSVSGSSARIASDGHGDIVAVWRELDGDDAAIHAAFNPAGEGWQGSRRISKVGAAAESPAVAMDRRGNIAVVWQFSADGHESVVQSAVRPVGEQWGAPHALSGPADVAFSANVSVANGHVTAAWIALRKRRTFVDTASRTVDGDWSAAETISNRVGNTYAPAVAVDDKGGAVVAWQWFDGAVRLVQASERPAGGDWSKPQTLSTPGKGATPPKLVIDGRGDALVGWMRSNGAWPAAQVASRPSGGKWSAPKNLSANGGRASSLDLAMSHDGDAIAVWNQARFKNLDLWSSMRAAGAGRWSARVRVTSQWAGLQPNVAIDEEGNATAVWASQSTVSASFKPAGGEWQDDYLLSDWDSDCTNPEVTVQNAKNATALWIEAAENDDRIASVSYDVDTSAKENADTADEQDCGEDCGDETGNEGDETGERFVGTPHADVLVGTPGDDVFYGLGGNDVIDGRGGRDVVHAGPGNDHIIGGNGSDRLYGENGNDRIDGGRGSDKIFGGPGDDRLAGQRDSDRLWGGSGRDRLSGGWGEDLIVGGAGRDVLRGDAGDDTLLAADYDRDLVLGAAGRDSYRLDRWLDRARSIESRYR